MIYNKIYELFKKGQSPYDSLNLQELSSDEVLLTASMSFGLTKDVNKVVAETLPAQASVNEPGLHGLKRASLLVDQLHLSGHMDELNAANTNRICSIVAKGVSELVKGGGESCTKNLPAMAYISHMNEALASIAPQSPIAKQVNTLFAKFERNQTQHIRSSHTHDAVANSLSDLVNEINSPSTVKQHVEADGPLPTEAATGPLTSEQLATNPDLLAERASDITPRMLNSAVYLNNDLFSQLNGEQIGMLHPALVEDLIATSPQQLSHVDAEHQTISMTENAVRADANSIESVKFKTDRLLDPQSGQLEANFRLVDAIDSTPSVNPLSTGAINKILSIGAQLGRELNDLGSQFYSSMAKPMAAFDTGLQNPPRTMHYVDAMLTKINEITQNQYLTPEQHRVADKLSSLHTSFHETIDRPSTLSTYVKENGNLMRETLMRNSLIRSNNQDKGIDDDFDGIQGYADTYKPVLTKAYVQANPEVMSSPDFSEGSRLRFIQAQGDLIQYTTAEQQTPELQIEAIRHGAGLHHLKLDLNPSELLKDEAKNLRHIETLMKAKTTPIAEPEVSVLNKITRATLTASEHALKHDKSSLTNASLTEKTPVQVVASIGSEVERISKIDHDLKPEKESVVSKIKNAFSHMVNKWFSKDQDTAKALDRVTLSKEELSEYYKDAIHYGHSGKGEAIEMNTSQLNQMFESKSISSEREYDAIEFKR
jgi:hypothetical protein